MAIVQICDFKEKDGVKMYRVNGDKADLEKILKTCREEGVKLEFEPELEYTRKGIWTILLRIKIPVGVGGDG
jgi:hypothetical protein